MPNPRPRPVPLAHFLKDGVEIWMRCRRCDRTVSVPTAEAIARWGAAATLDEVRGRCRTCGGRDVEVWPDWTKSRFTPKGMIVTPSRMPRTQKGDQQALRSVPGADAGRGTQGPFLDGSDSTSCGSERR